MEYSSFSSGTERAVKTWQVSLIITIIIIIIIIIKTYFFISA